MNQFKPLKRQKMSREEKVAVGNVANKISQISQLFLPVTIYTVHNFFITATFKFY